MVSTKERRENFIGNGKALRGEAGAGAVEEEEAVSGEGFEAWAEADVVALLKGAPVDTVEKTEAQEEFFVEGLLRAESFALLDGEVAGVDRGDVSDGIVGIGPARAAVEGMSAGAEAEVGGTSPVFEVVARTERGFRGQSP